MPPHLQLRTSHPADAIPEFNIFGLQRLFNDLGGIRCVPHGPDPSPVQPYWFCLQNVALQRIRCCSMQPKLDTRSRLLLHVTAQPRLRPAAEPRAAWGCLAWLKSWRSRCCSAR